MESDSFSARLEQKLDGVIGKCERWGNHPSTVVVTVFLLSYAALSLWTLDKYDYAEWTVYVMLLFGAPLLFQFFQVVLTTQSKQEKKSDVSGDEKSAHIISRGFYSIFGLIGTLLLFWAWLMYLLGKASFVYSVLCVLCSVIGALVAIIVTWIIMRRPAPHRRRLENIQKLRQGFARKPLSTVFFFLGLFLSVTYLLSFAFAFHNIDIYEKSQGQEVALDAGPEGKPTRALVDHASIGQAKTWIVFFVERSSVIDDTVESDEVSTLPDVLDHIEEYIDNPERATDFLLRNLNKKAINAIVGHIQYVNARSPYIRFKVILTGHANMDTPSPGSITNYALSEARGSSVNERLDERLGELVKQENIGLFNIEYTHIPRGDQTDKGSFKASVHSSLVFPEDTTLLSERQLSETIEKLRALDICPDSLLSVEVTVQPIENHPSQDALQRATEESGPPRKLNLLEYIYFTTYTITTTGYGDIKPTTYYAKFIVTFANLLEIFFLVVFFNALLSFAGSPEERKTAREREKEAQERHSELQRLIQDQLDGQETQKNDILTQLSKHQNEIVAQLSKRQTTSTPPPKTASSTDPSAEIKPYH